LGVCALLVVLVALPLAGQAAESEWLMREGRPDLEPQDALVAFRADSSLRVRGWKLGSEVYFGQARVGDRWGLGFVIDKSDYAYGLNNRGISIVRKF